MACVIQRVPREILIMIIELVIEDLADSTKQRQEAVYDLFTPHDERSAILQRSVVWKALLHDVSGVGLLFSFIVSSSMSDTLE